MLRSYRCDPSLNRSSRDNMFSYGEHVVNVIHHHELARLNPQKSADFDDGLCDNEIIFLWKPLLSRLKLWKGYRMHIQSCVEHVCVVWYRMSNMHNIVKHRVFLRRAIISVVFAHVAQIHLVSSPLISGLALFSILQYLEKCATACSCGSVVEERMRHDITWLHIISLLQQFISIIILLLLSSISFVSLFFSFS